MCQLLVRGSIRVLVRMAFHTVADRYVEQQNLEHGLMVIKNPLPYDLQQLHDYLLRQRSDRVVLYFSNSEALEGSVLVDVIDVLR